jgi:hypothetical protein
MKEVAFAFLANVAELLVDGRLVVIGPDIEGLNCSQIPIGVQLAFVAKLIFAAEEVSQSHTITIECARPDGTRAPISTPVPLGLRVNPEHPDNDAKAVVVAAIGITFDVPGKYTFYAMVDQEAVAIRSLNIALIPPSNAPISTTS